MDRSADRQATPEAFELPRALREVTPRYTVEAMLAKIEERFGLRWWSYRTGRSATSLWSSRSTASRA